MLTWVRCPCARLERTIELIISVKNAAIPELIIALFIFGIVVAVVGLYELDKRRFNLAFVNIGWDYFQVLSMFTDADVRWPAALKALYRFFSLFSFDIDIVAPECLVQIFHIN